MEYVDTVKTSASHDGSMDMMAMMMQMEKFPEFCEPFYYNTTTYQEITDLPAAGGTSSTTTVPLLFNANPNVLSQPPTSNIDNNHVNFVTMTTPPQPPLQVQQPKASSFLYPSSLSTENKNVNSMAAMREMIFRMAVMQPVHIDPESVKPPKRRNVKISKDPQSVAARHRRERISERIRILQRLVPGGTKMDTASMLDEAIHYVKFLKKQVQTLEQAGGNNRQHINNIGGVGVGFTGMSNFNNVNYSNSALWNMKGCQPQPACQMVGSTSKQLLS